MYCSRCGNQLDEGQAFCEKCGNQVGGSGGGQPQRVIYVPEKSAGIAAVLSFIWAGAGQLYAGKIARGLMILLIYSLIWVFQMFVLFVWASSISTTGDVYGILVMLMIFFVFVIVLWVWNIFDAYKQANEYNRRLRETGNPPW